MSIKNPTIYLSSSRTSPNPLTKGHLIYHRMENASIMLRASIKKHSTKMATAIISLSNRARPPDNERNTRQRNILWFDLPYSKSVATNAGKYCLSLTNKHFPKSNPFHKIFNLNTLKLSYSCMGNSKIIISNHNKAENPPTPSIKRKTVIAGIPTRAL